MKHSLRERILFFSAIVASVAEMSPAVVLVIVAFIHACASLPSVDSATVSAVARSVVPAVETVKAVETCLAKCDGNGHLVDQAKRAGCHESASNALAAWCTAGVLICTKR